MKTILIIILLTITTIYPQLTSFERVYLNQYPGSNIKSVSDGYIAITPYSTTVRVVHTNLVGEIDWSFTFNGLNYTSSKSNIVQLQTNNEYLFVSAINSSSNNSDLFLCKLSTLGDTIWSKTIDMGAQEQNLKTLVVNNDSLVILFKNETGLNFLKTDSEGNVAASNFLGALTIINTWPDIERTIDSSYIVSFRGNILKLNADGQILWQKSSSLAFFDLVVTQNGLYLSSNNNVIHKFDLNGNALNSQSFEPGSRFLLNALNDKIILVSSVSTEQNIITIADSNLNILETKDLNGIPVSMDITVDSSLVIMGRLDFLLWILKTDQNVEYTSVVFTSGYHKDFYLPGEYYKFYYKARNINSSLKIEYSSNFGNSWNLIINNLSPDSTECYLQIPLLISDSAFLKISSSTNEEIFCLLNYKSAPGRVYEYIAGNEIKMWIGNIGDGSHNPVDDGPGFMWPGGENATLTAIYQDGLLFGGSVNGEIRINGNTHRQGVRPGVILNNGLPANPDSTRFVVWKLRSDWETLPPGPERDKYQLIYNNWPMDIGAPYIDVDENGIFTPGIDHPDYIGDEVLYYVANDLDSATSTFVYGTYPIGLEFQTTTFAFDRDDELDNVVYKKYRVINKGNNTVQNMFLSYWHDINLGNANDDRTGSDSTLNLSYVFNENENDVIYGSPPPAVGYRIVQGPIVSATPQDSAFYNGSWRTGFINLPVYSYYPYFWGGPLYRDPQQGIPVGSIESYNNMLGLHWDGTLMINPLTNNPTKFFCSGDPVTGVGWFEGLGWPGGPLAGDKRGLLSSGPFNFAPGDTQEIVIAICIAKGTDRLNSITKLKNTSQAADNFFKSNYTFTSAQGNNIPLKYDLSQNYPNPFNPTTTIKFEIANPGNVELIIYNILGQKVQTLINEYRNAGSYELRLNGTDLASGMYIYQLKSGDFISSKKMLMIK